MTATPKSPPPSVERNAPRGRNGPRWRRAAISLVISVTLVPGAAATSTPSIAADDPKDPEPGTMTDATTRIPVRFERLAARPIDTGGWGAVFDVVSAGEKLVAVGYSATYDTSHAAAWTSRGGRKWRESHGPLKWTLGGAIALHDGSVLAFQPVACGTRMWRLQPGGAMVDTGLVWKSRKNCRNRYLVAVAGRPGSGMVAVIGEWVSVDGEIRHRYRDKESTQVISRTRGGRWRPVPVSGVERVQPFDVVRTAEGFVLIGEGTDGALAWRSADGLGWQGPEVLPGPETPLFFHALRETMYDRDRGILLVVAYPDLVWRSVAGAPFERVGPLPAKLSADGSDVAAVALEDGFLLSSGSYGDLRLQGSRDGAEWELVPLNRRDTEGMTYMQLVRHGDHVVAIGGNGGPVARGPATIEAYLPAIGDAGD